MNARIFVVLWDAISLFVQKRIQFEQKRKKREKERELEQVYSKEYYFLTEKGSQTQKRVLKVEST